MAITIRGVPKTSPAVRDVLSSKETPDGSPRYGLFASDLKKERRAWAKLAFLVSPSIPLAIELMMAFIKTFGLITIFMFLFISIYFGKSCFKQACTLLTMS
jgi:hypothetical protein